jgi:hypothetical protein
MMFYNGKSFPATYQGGIFSAQYGSWNRTQPVGARIMFTSLKPDGTADKTEPFAEGWLNENGEFLWRVRSVPLHHFPFGLFRTAPFTPAPGSANSGTPLVVKVWPVPL